MKCQRLKILKKRVYNIKEKTSGHHKWKMFIYAGIIIIIFLYIWLFYTNTGWLVRTSFLKSFEREPDRVVKVYTGSELVGEYVGKYSVENYQGYLVLIDHEHQQRINLYGDVVAIVDIPKDQQMQK